jgi:hypothetical protein
VRTAYYKYLHPKECLIENSKTHTEFLRTIKKMQKNKRINLDEDLLEDDNNGFDLNSENNENLNFVYPFGQSLDVDNTASVLFNSGIIAYPASRPLCAAATSKSRMGKLIVIGSEKFFADEYIEKEENKKITVKICFDIFLGQFN